MEEPSSAPQDVTATPTAETSASASAPAPLPSRHRRILGVLMEKARTTPDAYPLTLNALVTGCNQKSNRHPIMNLTVEQVEDELIQMRQRSLVAEVHGTGRVAKFRHLAYDYLGVRGVEAAVMTELLLRGEQTAGELRTRASRFDAIADLASMQQILNALRDRGLVQELSPPGRGQLFSHNLYLPEELAGLRREAGDGGESGSPSRTAAPAIGVAELEQLRQEIAELRNELSELRERLDRIES